MYNGDHIYFFGGVPDPSADVIVKLTSTENVPLSVNRKGRVGIVWMNVKQFTVTGLPLLYKIHSTRPIQQILGRELAAELGIGYDVLKDQPLGDYVVLPPRVLNHDRLFIDDWSIEQLEEKLGAHVIIFPDSFLTLFEKIRILQSGLPPDQARALRHTPPLAYLTESSKGGGAHPA